MDSFTLRDPALLWVALAIPLAIWWRERRPDAALAFAAGRFLTALPGSLRTRLRLLPTGLKSAALLCLVLALARPQVGEPLPLTRRGLDVFLCLDVSSSMTAHDLDPGRTRLDVVRAAARAFIEGRPEDRFGLVSFARYPDLRAPLTLDRAAMQELLTDLAPVEREDPEDATGIGTALAMCARGFQHSAPDSRVVVLLTDGDENVASAATPDEIAPLHAAQLCERMGIRVYAISAGIGRRDRQGQWIPTDTRQLREVARRSGGQFFEARDATAIRQVYDAIDRLETAPFDEPRHRWVDRFVPVLLAGVALWLAGHVLGRAWLEPLP